MDLSIPEASRIKWCLYNPGRKYHQDTGHNELAK